MSRLLKEDVLLYLEENRINSVQQLHQLVKKNVLFEDVSERVVRNRLRELRDDDLAEDLSPTDNTDTYDVLGFLYWCKHRNIKWRDLLEENLKELFKEVLKAGKVSSSELRERLNVSRPTIYKYIDLLEQRNFVRRTSEKPIEVEPRLNDTGIFYANLIDADLESFADNFDTVESNLDRELKKQIARIHTYSTTVTEGNTATQEEVRKVLDNFPTDLTPKEILEIENSNRAVEKLREFKDKEITLERIQKLNELVTYNLVENPGEIKYGRKNISGSRYKPPSRKKTIKHSLNALESFIEKYSCLKTEVLGAIAHFLLVSIHPFEDGNGRTARLLHSWILLRNQKTLFVYDPDHQREYLQKLEKANQKDISGFIQFCIEKHRSQLQKITNRQKNTS